MLRNYVDGPALRRRFYPESNIGGFSYADAGVAMYMQIDSTLRPTDRVLDFGAGRGEQILDNDVEYRRRLFNLRGRCAHVEGCDIDEAVLDNPFLDHAEVTQPGKSLPYPNDSFDVIYCRFVFEHVQEPHAVAAELMRVLRPGGLLAALTPNKYGYIAVAGAVVPNRLHVRALKYIQPKRKSVDVFPTVYGLNTRKDIRSAFGAGAETFVVYLSGEPAYHFGSPVLFRVFKWLHKHLLSSLQPLLIVYVRKKRC